MISLDIPSGKESEDLPYLYWIPKLYKTPYKERYIAGSSTCSKKELSIHLDPVVQLVVNLTLRYLYRVVKYSNDVLLNPTLKLCCSTKFYRIVS